MHLVFLLNLSAPCIPVHQVSDLCVGQTSCPVQSTIVPDPCYGIFKWGTVSYTCVPIPGTGGCARGAMHWIGDRGPWRHVSAVGGSRPPALTTVLPYVM